MAVGSHRTILRVVAIVIAVAMFVFVGSVAWSIWHRTNPATHTFAFDANATLTEEVAIEYTRRALTVEGKERPQMRPLPYWPEHQFKDSETERLFARNRINPNSGYVIWSVGYSVHIERVGDQIACRVFVIK